MDYGNKIGTYFVRWKYSDNYEEVHVHFSTNSQYDCAKIWISVSLKEVIVEHNKGQIPRSEMKKLIKETLKHVGQIVNDWITHVDDGEISFIDENGRKEKWDYRH